MRREKDTLGEREVPEEVLWGIETSRAVENFPISGLRPHPAFIRASALVKLAAAQANMALGELDPTIGKAIIEAAREIMEGRWHDQFVVDVYQAGAGTSHNMNTNEVIANRALELLGKKKGDYSTVHPHDHVNRAQSTNDFFPTAMRLACLSLVGGLVEAIKELEAALGAKGREFHDVLKTARTHLQDAVPIRLGQEFAAYSLAVAKARRRIGKASEALYELNLGATAAGTGLGAHPHFREEAVARLREITGWPLRPARNLVEITQSTADFAHLSSSLRLLALELTRIANDLRLLSSGPRAGLGEINLPPVQPGSSLMPGKVNPVMAEMLNMVCFQVIGNDLAIGLADQAGQLDLNVMMPVIAFNLFHSLEILKNGVRAFTQRCVLGITANRERCLKEAEESPGLATALSKALGYDRAAQVAREALATGRTIKEVVIAKGLLPPQEIARLFDLSRLAGE